MDTFDIYDISCSGYFKRHYSKKRVRSLLKYYRAGDTKGIETILRSPMVDEVDKLEFLSRLPYDVAVKFVNHR